MKKLITTTLLFAGLTIGAQENFIKELQSKFFSDDTTTENGIDYFSKYTAHLVSRNDRQDTICLNVVVRYDTDYNLKVKLICLVQFNNFKKIKNVNIVFENKDIKFHVSKDIICPYENSNYITTKQNVKVEDFLNPLNMVVINGDAYVPLYTSEIYFSYIFSPFEYLKLDWFK